MCSNKTERINTGAYSMANNIRFSATEVASYYRARVPNLKQTKTGPWRTRCPIHQGRRDSFSVNSKTGEWRCLSKCKRGGDIIALEGELAKTDFKTALDEVSRIVGRVPKKWRTVARYV